MAGGQTKRRRKDRTWHWPQVRGGNHRRASEAPGLAVGESRKRRGQGEWAAGTQVPWLEVAAQPVRGSTEAGRALGAGVGKARQRGREGAERMVWVRDRLGERWPPGLGSGRGGCPPGREELMGLAGALALLAVGTGRSSRIVGCGRR